MPYEQCPRAVLLTFYKDLVSIDLSVKHAISCMSQPGGCAVVETILLYSFTKPGL